MGISWEAAYATAFQIQVSNDNATWTTIYSTTTGAGGNETFTVSATDRYIRMYGTVRATQSGYSIFEFDVYGLTTTAPLTGGNGNGGNGTCPWVGSTAPVAQRVRQVLTTMDQSEEFTLLSGDGGSSYIGQVAAIPNLCIPAINMEDGPNGVGDGTGGVTAFPDGENAAATWDPSLIQQEGAAMGAEFAGKGVNVSLGPTTNLVRDPRWGRTYETYGEDPYLAGQITAAEAEGLQSQGVMAMVKHAAAYDQEQYPNGNNDETISQQALEELYLAPFQAAIDQAAPASVVCSYAVINGNASCQNGGILQKGLDDQANWGGFVTSDWGADYNNVASVEGGMDIRMPFPGSIASDLSAAISNGTLSQYTVNEAVGRILTQMFAFGMFDNPQAGSLSTTVTTAAHQQTALQLGEEGTVLLKNNGILPLNPNGTESIAVIGTDGGAGVEIAGGGSGTVIGSNTIWPLTGIQDAAGQNVKVTYTAGDDNGTTDIPQAVAATVTDTGSVAGADVAQMYVGDPAASQDPPQQLRGFRRVTLNPGQSATVSFPLTIHDLASWSPAASAWEVQAGAHRARASRWPTQRSARTSPRTRVCQARRLSGGQPLRLQQPQGCRCVLRHAGAGLRLVPDPHLHRHRAAARHHHRLERDDLRFRQHARDLHRDRDRD